MNLLARIFLPARLSETYSQMHPAIPLIYMSHHI